MAKVMLGICLHPLSLLWPFILFCSLFKYYRFSRVAGILFTGILQECTIQIINEKLYNTL